MRYAPLPELDSSLVAVGWREHSQSSRQESGKLDALYESNWGVLGVILCESPEAVIKRWAAAQAKLGYLKGTDTLGVWRDYYLLILVRTVGPQDWGDLRDIVGDTHVCRKICEVIGDRRVQSIVQQSPVLNLHWAESPMTDGAAIDPHVSRLSSIPAKLADDLARRRPEVILERLLSGEYDEEAADEA